MMDRSIKLGGNAVELGQKGLKDMLGSEALASPETYEAKVSLPKSTALGEWWRITARQVSIF